MSPEQKRKIEAATVHSERRFQDPYLNWREPANKRDPDRYFQSVEELKREIERQQIEDASCEFEEDYHLY
jgi:hypothetical protein